jgi:hypothetical protein
MDKEAGLSLNLIIEDAANLQEVRKSEVRLGDLVLITTRNSVYSIYVLGSNVYLVSGGWFDRKQQSPARVSIRGCTWGGRVIKTDSLAACGLRLEFSNRVVTTAIQEIQLLRDVGGET